MSIGTWHAKMKNCHPFDTFIGTLSRKNETLARFWHVGMWALRPRWRAWHAWNVIYQSQILDIFASHKIPRTLIKQQSKTLRFYFSIGYSLFCLFIYLLFYLFLLQKYSRQDSVLRSVYTRWRNAQKKVLKIIIMLLLLRLIISFLYCYEIGLPCLTIHIKRISSHDILYKKFQMAHLSLYKTLQHGQITPYLQIFDFPDQ